ncbi:uncharacterized protein B0I36DRAFT_383912 [Microdochium trichocladiopsis]|uniref:Uncharacterized protein n=1 Tax=Microdochium trichocladiopsis TaxID=1682393 RepID=A0A9P8Y7B2_9PEZI|nr:uncharacterized protein B0I36DRAFT_383912 [Microdochium trichocladiopsis]KAH7031043.1 hypothetical protein B0I36DRAFT_383912 [Microdochium trichocladiopsis]
MEGTTCFLQDLVYSTNDVQIGDDIKSRIPISAKDQHKEVVVTSDDLSFLTVEEIELLDKQGRRSPRDVSQWAVRNDNLIFIWAKHREYSSLVPALAWNLEKCIAIEWITERLDTALGDPDPPLTNEDTKRTFISQSTSEVLLRKAQKIHRAWRNVCGEDHYQTRAWEYILSEEHEAQVFEPLEVSNFWSRCDADWVEFMLPDLWRAARHLRPGIGVQEAMERLKRDCIKKQMESLSTAV